MWSYYALVLLFATTCVMQSTAAWPKDAGFAIKAHSSVAQRFQTAIMASAMAVGGDSGDGENMSMGGDPRKVQLQCIYCGG